MMNEESFSAFLQNRETLQRFSERYRADAALRDRLAGGDYSDLDVEVPPGVEIRVVLETPDTYYCPMPQDPNQQLGDEALDGIAGGNTHVSTVATAGTVGSIPSCIGSFGSAGSLSSVEVDASGNRVS